MPTYHIDALTKMEECIMERDYSVTWNDVKNRIEKNLKEKRGKSGDDKIPIGVIEFALKDVWNDLFNEINENL